MKRERMQGNGDHNKSELRRYLALLGAPLRRRMAADPILVGTFALVILITATAVAAIPIILNQVGDDGMYEALDRAVVIQRGVQVELEGRLPTSGGDPLGLVGERGDRYRDNLPESMQAIVDDVQWTADSARYHMLLDDLTIATGPTSQYFQFRYQSGLEDQIELIEGREPESADPIQLSDATELPDTVEDGTVLRYEVKIGQGTADIMDLSTGDFLVVRADSSDLRNRGAPLAYYAEHVVVEVVGVFETTDPDSDFWFMDSRTFETDVITTPDESIYYSMGIPAEADYPELLGLNEPGFWSYRWRLFVEPGSVAMADADQVASDLRSVVQNRGPYQELADLDPPAAARQISIRSLLPTLLTGAERQYNLTSAVLSLVIAGIVTIGVAISGLLGALVASRRTPEIALMRSRGASTIQLSLSQISEGLLLALPAAGLGVVLAGILTNGTPTLDSLIAAGAVGVIGVLALWSLTRRIWAVDLGSLMGRRAGVPEGSTLRRIVAEGVVVVLAVAGIVILRQRGVTTGSEVEGFDPYVAAVPVLAGIATGIVAVRLFPWLLRNLASVAGRRTDIVPFLGLRRIAEPSLGRHLPLVVMILALGVAVFAGAIWYSIETPEPIPIEQLEAETGEAPGRAGVNEAFQQGITQGFWLTIFMAGIYAGLSVICALALTAEERRRDVGYLRTMGATRDQAVGLTLIEQIPSALLAGFIGAVFGGVLTWLIAPGLDIASLYPPEEQVVIGINWVLAAAQAFGLVVIAVGAALVFAWIARRSDLSDVLRAGE